MGQFTVHRTGATPALIASSIALSLSGGPSQSAGGPACGLWYEITESGRQSWLEHQPSADRHAAWSLDEIGNNTVSIRAESEEVAEDTLRWWLAERAPKNLSLAEKRIRAIDGFALKDGS